MYSFHGAIAAPLMLLAMTGAALHDQNSAMISKTVVVTISRTIDQHSQTSSSLCAHSVGSGEGGTSAYAAKLVGSTLACPDADYACILDDVTLSLSSTASLTGLVSTSTVDPLLDDNTSIFETPSKSSATSFRSEPKAPKEDFHILPIDLETPASTSTSRSTPQASAPNTAPALPGDEVAIRPTTVVKSTAVDPVAWSGMDNALESRTRRMQENMARSKRRKAVWSRFFAAA
jgi:hypothetical protein